MYGLKNEGNLALVNHLSGEGIDIRKNPVEFMTYEFTTRGGINYDEKGETSLKGLYAAGDEYFGGISCAATFGWIAGENAANYINKVKASELNKLGEDIEKKRNSLTRILGRQTGVGWQEANIALQQIMQDYAGTVRTESLLKAGLSHVQRLKKKVHTTISAKNQHELMHCLEVLNLLDIGELVFAAIMERKESRGKYSRQDYPFTNPLLNNKVLICKQVKGKPALEWREVKD